MIHSDIQSQLALLVKTSAPPLFEVATSPAESPQWTPGQRLPAFVIASLPNGRFQVQVEDQVLDMNLPRNTEAGQKLDLTFLAASPRLTFALSQDLAGALPSGSGVSLSETAKFLGALLQRGGAEEGKALATPAAGSVLAGAPQSIRDFASALQGAVSRSGLFYESHQAQWVTGERTLAALLQEPQARLSSAGEVPRDLTATLPGAAASLPRTAGLDATALAQALGQDADAKIGMPRELVHAQALPLVHQQLETLDTRQIVWQGQVWPGQQMDWRIEDDEARRESADGDEPQWRTRLHLELPSLGGVTARLAFGSSGIRIEMQAEKGDSAALMRGDAATLLASMEASGLRLAALSIGEGVAGDDRKDPGHGGP